MNSIDLYDIHDTVFINRPECNACPAQRGDDMDAQCLTLEAMNHEACPFVKAVLDDVSNMYHGDDRSLVIDFADKMMELNLDKREREWISISPMVTFISENRGILKPILTDFFNERIVDLNNYRGVLNV